MKNLFPKLRLLAASTLQMVTTHGAISALMFLRTLSSTLVVRSFSITVMTWRTTKNLIHFSIARNLLSLNALESLPGTLPVSVGTAESTLRFDCLLERK